MIEECKKESAPNGGEVFKANVIYSTTKSLAAFNSEGPNLLVKSFRNILVNENITPSPLVEEATNKLPGGDVEEPPVVAPISHYVK